MRVSAGARVPSIVGMAAAVLVVAAIAIFATGGRALAQSFLYRPAAPSAGVSALLDARYQHIHGVGSADLHAGQLGLALEARALPDVHLELGATWGVRGSVVALDGVGSRARVGMPPLAVFIGTGGAIDDATSFGVRLVTGASFALLGVDDLSSNGSWAFAEIEGALATRCTDFALEARAAVGAAYAGDTAVSGVVRAGVGVELGAEMWALRPYAGATLAYATDMGFGGELLLGAATLVDGATLRFGVGVKPWSDPSGDLVRVWVGTNVGL